MHCSHHAAARCRSCTELARPYAVQLAAKQAHCQSLLATHAGIDWLPPVESAESGFRNKAKMVVSGTAAAPLLGIRDEAGRGVDLSDCGLYPPSMQACFPAIAAFIRQATLDPYDLATRRGELKFVLLTEAPDGALGLRFVLRSEATIARIVKHLPSLLAALPTLAVVSANIQPEHKAVLEGPREILLGEQTRLLVRVNDISLHLRPQSFFQTNTAIAAALYAQARDWIAECAPAAVWDLYCGVGGFALHAAGAGLRVTGVELEAEAITSARQAAADAGITAIDWVAADATAWAQAQATSAELVIVNPPRRGIGAILSQRLEAATTTRWLIYSSCNAESLARDLALMPSFQPRRARLLDMFPQTRHYEVIVLLERVSSSKMA
ncbi:23S rRNA (uracil(747)-C(5))-methyltransferase RlmC [Nevskia sp.]|uniref:23S rRNA (uracil(747)-C(5))-methyltransferase RlmC n=1 Tax=Nevskia sp. TaxID=1929292 RepID=UPI0025D4477A|nr:23S rRNA (uracil(747)-C(5))-methyltransferase RlmC [Nevskia sp.]